MKILVIVYKSANKKYYNIIIYLNENVFIFIWLIFFCFERDEKNSKFQKCVAIYRFGSNIPLIKFGFRGLLYFKRSTMRPTVYYR